MIIEPSLTPEMIQQIIDRQHYKDGGGKISCGHDFWERAKQASPGDVVLCTACFQYFVKTKGFPWVVEGGHLDIEKRLPVKPKIAHQDAVISDGVCYVPVTVRVTTP